MTLTNQALLAAIALLLTGTVSPDFIFTAYILCIPLVWLLDKHQSNNMRNTP